MRITTIEQIKNLNRNEPSTVAESVLEAAIQALSNHNVRMVFVQPVTIYGQCFLSSYEVVYLNPWLLSEAKIALKEAGYRVRDEGQELFSFWIPFEK